MSNPGDEIAIIGSGGVGGFLAAELAGAGHAVALCVRTPFDTLTVESGGATRTVPVRQVRAPADARLARWILLTTKSQDTASAKPWVDALAGPGTTLVMVQNGIEHLERAAPMQGATTVLPAIIYCSVERTRPGHVVHHNSARLVVPKGPASEDLARLFEGTVFSVEPQEDFKTAAWRKLFGNLSANPVTALTLRRMPMFREAATLDLAREILTEAAAVARADGAAFGPQDVEAILKTYAGWTTDSGTSMMYDRLAERPLEHEHITGALVRAAERHGIAVPVNRTILSLLTLASGHRLDATG